LFATLFANKVKKMQKNSKESRLGRFGYLLKGGTRPRRSHALMIALVLVALLSFAGIVSADDFWKGAAPVTKVSGTVNGDVDVQYADTWKTTNPIDTDDAWANFTLAVTPSNDNTLKFARLYIVMYTANMTDNWKGNFSVTLKDGTYDTYAYPVVHKALNLNYVNSSGATNAILTSTEATKSLSRVTSDYVAVVDVKDTLQLWGNADVRVHVETWNESLRLQSGLTRFDGRIKEVKLVYGWNVSSGSTGDTKYWVNEGHDTMTRNISTYTGNKTWFNSTGSPATYTAKLWEDYSATYAGNGTYTWNGVDISRGSAYPPTLTSGTYAGINYWTWSNAAGPGLSANNVLTYSRTNDWFKIPLAVLTVK
jgi:hypothetical protein